jgi:hypothetical protein
VASIFKKDKRRKNSPWYIDYFDEHGQRQRVKGCPDRTATEQIARKLETEVELRRRGLIDPKAERISEAARRPILDHLSDFIATLGAKGNDPKHVRLARTYVARVLELAMIDRQAEVLDLHVSVGKGG